MPNTTRVRRSSKPQIAIVGAGLTGLTAAYTLRDRAYVTMLEREPRPGGRLLTWSTPPGEQGAEFFWESDGSLVGLLRKLKIPSDPVNEECWYRFEGRQSPTGLSHARAADHLLPPDSATRVRRVLAQARGGTPRAGASFRTWLNTRLEQDRRAISFVQMILATEACAPLAHLSVDHALGCLGSASWFRIRGGTARLIAGLMSTSNAKFEGRTRATTIDSNDSGVTVRFARSAGRTSERRRFDGVIITVPEGERLFGMRVPRHWHPYVSVLLEFESRWWHDSGVRLQDGMYTDSTYNYIQAGSRRGGSTVVRLLIPCAEHLIRQGDTAIVRGCGSYLQTFGTPSRVIRSSVKKWTNGLPCPQGAEADNAKWVKRITGRAYLAGDRFGSKWASMNTAVLSGQRAATGILNELQ